MSSEYTPIHEAAAYLASVCDYAATEDGRGYNGTDTWFGHAVAATPVEQWDADTAAAVWGMIRKYKGQLAAEGIDYDAMPVPAEVRELAEEQQKEYAREARQRVRDGIKERRHAEALKAKNYVSCSGDGEPVIVAFAYNADMVNEARKIPGREFRGFYDGHRKVNVYPFGSLPQVLEFADRHGLHVPEEVRALSQYVPAWLAQAAAREAEEAAKKAAEPHVFVAEGGRGIYIKADYNPILNDALREWNGGRSTWDSGSRVHRPKLKKDPAGLLKLITRFRLNMTEEARDLVEAAAAEGDIAYRMATALTADPITIPGLNPDRALKPIQFPVVHFALRYRRILLGDEMGYGKTLSSLASVAAAGKLPAVVVCRPSLTLNWKREINEFFPAWKVFIAEGTRPEPIPHDTDIIIIGTAALGNVLKPVQPVTKAMEVYRAPGVKKLTSTRTGRAVRAARAARFLTANARYNTPALAARYAADVARRPVSADTIAALLDGDTPRLPRRFVFDLEFATQVMGKQAFPWLRPLVAMKPQALIVDEGQDTKEQTANRSQAVLALAEDIRAVSDDTLVMDLTGTAIINRPVELANQLDILGRIDEFGGNGGYRMRYCAGEANEHGTKFDGAHHLDELHDKLLRSGTMIRRNDDAALGLPERRRHILHIPVEALDPKIVAEYVAADADTAEHLAEQARKIAKRLGKDPESAAVQARMKAGAAEHLVRLNTLRKLIGQAKRPVIEAWVAEQVARGEKVMVAAHHRPVVSGYAKRFGGLKIQGDQTTESKEEHKARFQTDPDAMVISVAIAAGGVGHTLTAARIGIQAEVAWTPGDTNQMEKRIHRIGQTREVDYTVALVPGTVDDEIWNVVTRKQAILDAVLDGKEPDGVDVGDNAIVAEVAWQYALKGLRATT